MDRVLNWRIWITCCLWGCFLSNVPGGETVWDRRLDDRVWLLRDTAAREVGDLVTIRLPVEQAVHRLRSVVVNEQNHLVCSSPYYKVS